MTAASPSAACGRGIIGAGRSLRGVWGVLLRPAQSGREHVP